jgi:hypothetical protein
MNQKKKIITVEAVKAAMNSHIQNAARYLRVIDVDDFNRVIDTFQDAPEIKFPENLINSMPSDADLENWVMDGDMMNEKNAQRMKAAICVRDKIMDLLINCLKGGKE